MKLKTWTNIILVFASCVSCPIAANADGSCAAKPAKQLVKDLTKALKDKDPAVRAGAAPKLGDLGPDAADAAAALVALLEDKEERVVVEAHVALSRIGGHAVPFLISALQNENREVAKNAMYILLRFGSDGSPAVPHLIRIMKDDKDEKLRSIAMDALSGIGGKAALDAIVDVALFDRSDDMQLGAIMTLGQFGPKAKSAIPILGAILTSDVDETKPNFRRRLAASSLACIGGDAVPVLVEVLSNRDVPATVRQDAIEALGRMAVIHTPKAPKDAVGPLIKALADKDRHVRREIAGALGCMEKHAKAARSALTDALDDEDPDVRIEAAYALYRIEPGDTNVAVTALIKCLEDTDNKVRSYAVDTLGRMDRSAKLAVWALANLVKDSDLDLRVKSIDVLGDMGPDAKEALPALKAALNDKDARTQIHAARAIKKIAK